MWFGITGRSFVQSDSFPNPTDIEVVVISSPQFAGNRPSVDPGSPTKAREFHWLISVWVVVALFAAVTFIRSYQVGIPIRDPNGEIFRWRIVLSLAWFGLLIFVDAAIRIDRSGWTFAKATKELRRRWTRERLALAFSGLLAYHFVYWSYHNLKSWNALNPVRDDQMLRLDKWLFFGHDPAVLLHDALGQHVATYVLAVVYESFSYLVPLSFVAALVFAHRIRDGYVFLASSLWVWILGTFSYYLIPTLGPFASAPKEFAQLPHTVITSAQTKYMADRTHFLDNPAASDAFNSVNAFASLHVGFTFMVLLMMRYYGFRRATRVMTIYIVAVMVSTIWFGWHFAVDDLAGLILAYLAVLFGRLMIYPRGRPSQSSIR